jgi:hypothetical protein
MGLRREKSIFPMRIPVRAVRGAWALFLIFFSVGAAWAGDDLAQQMAEYRQKLAVYNEARAAYDELARPYWASISEKRKRRIVKQRNGEPPDANDYVLKQPPLYSGPPRPQNPEKPRGDNEYIPVVADFLEQAKEQFGFSPDRPATDDDYRRVYAKAAIEAGLTAEQCVKIFAFESGGDGGYAVQAGLEYDRPGARAISTALGYNQLLTTNSVELLAEVGDRILASLREKARHADGAGLERLEEKIATLKKMIAFSHTVPDSWSAHSRLASTAKGLGIHALILDIDVGPLLQVHKLLTSVTYAKRKGYSGPLTAAELEMMNLTGDGTGFDMVTMPDALRNKVPTSNFFQQGGYERNPVAIRNNTVAKLLAATDAKMEEEAQLPAARVLAAAFREMD